MQFKILGFDVDKGAITQLWAGLSPEITLAHSGAFLVPWARITSYARRELQDVEKVRDIMELIQKQVTDALQ